MNRCSPSNRTTALAATAAHIRRQVLEMCVHSGGHLASSLSCVEILVALYHGGRLRIDPRHPEDPNRDRFILSKGHAETVLYAVLADRGFFPEDWLTTRYRRGDCLLGGHPDRRLAGVEASTGALGHGLGLGAGMALALKADGRNARCIVLLGDGECNEGSVWEAAMFAAGRRLNNLVAIVDRNRIGSLDFTENVTALEPLADKWRAFGWQVAQCDGHDLQALDAALAAAASAGAGRRPRVILAHTVKGKGIDFMENDPSWHVRQLTDPEQIQQARCQLAGREGV